MSLEYPCIYHEKGKCRKDEEPGIINYCAYGPCTQEVPSRGDLIRRMDDPELTEKIHELYLLWAEGNCGDISKLFCDGKAGCETDDGDIICNDEKRKACILRYLRSPAEEVRR